MELKVYRFGCEKVVDKVNILDNIVLSTVNPSLVKLVVDSQLINRMSGCHNAKTISDVSGTTKKPFKQKGTGRARQGSSRSPHMRGGSQSHGPTPRVRHSSINKKVKLKALSSAISDKVLHNNMFVVSDLSLNSYKTKDVVPLLSSYNQSSFFFVYDDEELNNFKMSTSNIHNVSSVPVVGINVYDIVKHSCLIFTKKAIIKLEKRFLDDK